MRKAQLSSPATIAASTLLMLAATPGDLVAQTSVDRSFDPSPKSCAEVRWSQPVLEAFPSIGEACQSIEQRNGKTYVKLEGTVEEVRAAGKRIRVDFKDGNDLTFTPTPRTGLYIDGERTPFGELNDGTELNFYIPEDRLQAELQPQPDRLAFIIVPLDISVAAIPSREQSVAQSGREEQRAMSANSDQRSELPRTAGPLPLIAFGGIVLIMLGGGATLLRKLR